MFSPDIVGSDAFVDMPMSAQALYFHMCMHADDDGFIGRPKQICRMVGANEDDLKILFAKRFLLQFDSNVAVVKHWLIHNLIRSDLYVETTYKQEKETLGLNEFGGYTELRDDVVPIKKIDEPVWLKKRRGERNITGVKKSPNPTTVQKRTDNVPSAVRKRHVGKDRLGKDRLGNIDTNVSIGAVEPPRTKTSSHEIDFVISAWEEFVGLEIANDDKQRNAASKLIKRWGVEKAIQLVKGAGRALDDQYAPRIANLTALVRKADDLILWGRKTVKNDSRGFTVS